MSMLTIFTYTNPRGRRCINFGDYSEMTLHTLNEYGHYKELKVIRRVVKFDTALRYINKLAVEKGLEIAG